jgi:exopolysaccharide biosynthesis WecB/TagA/CpsF family protein/anti-anti-sigma factor
MFDNMTPSTTWPSPGSRPPISILGVRFDNVTISETLDRIETMIASRRPHYVVTANVDFVVQAQTDIELRRIFFEAHLVLCDGTPLVWASRLLGNPLRERVAGADIVPLLIERAEQKSYRLFFLGAAPESIERAVANMRNRHPGLNICGFYSPPFNQLLEMNHDEIRKRILEAQPDILLVSLGCPKQEKWVAMNYRTLGVPVTIGVGATIDFLAGQVRRAPVWMQRSGLEWIFRLLQEPRRLYRRYSKDIWVFGRRLSFQLWQLRPRKTVCSVPKAHPTVVQPSNVERTASAALSTSPTNDVCPEGASELSVPKGHSKIAQRFNVGKGASEISPEGTAETTDNEGATLPFPAVFDHRAAEALTTLFTNLLNRADDCFLDLSNVQLIDSTGVAVLMSLQQQLATQNRHLVLLAPTPAVTRAFAFKRLENFFLCASNFTQARELLQNRAHESEESVGVEQHSGFRALVWHGEITAVNADDVWERTRAHIEQALRVRNGDLWSSLNTPRSVPPPRHLTPDTSLVIDLSVVRFIDSSGLGLMVRVRKFARQAGINLRFTNLQPAVLNVIRIARLEEFLLDQKRAKFALIPHLRPAPAQNAKTDTELVSASK